MNIADRKHEVNHMKKIKNYPNLILNEHKHSVQQGFAYFDSDEYKNSCTDKPAKGPRSNIKKNGLARSLKAIKELAPNMLGIFSGMKKNFVDAEVYLDELESSGGINLTGEKHLKSFPNTAIWNKLKDYAWNNHRAIIGFTKVPSQYIFKGKALLFRYALVFIEEMSEELINTAPEIEVNFTVMRVYNTLGKATNDIARLLREEFDIKCIASHPMGGVVDTTPLAEKAGMGKIGHSGLLITPQFGTRHRIATIFIDTPIFNYTDNNDHDWVVQFCDQCRQCEKKCPPKAINTHKKTYIKYNDLPDRVASIDRHKCYPYFCETGGCGVCIKVCPFSNSTICYNNVKKKYI